jgi:hypothetical protein
MTEAKPAQLDWLIDYTPLRSLPLDQEALRIFEYAYRVGLKTEEESAPPISFSTLLIALLDGEDDTSQWFSEVAMTIGPKRLLVYAEKNFNKKSFEADTLPPVAAQERVRLVSDGQLLTQSAQTVLQNAEQRALQVGGSDIGVRHLVASYVLNPPLNHRAQMQRWQFNESKWRSEFFPWVAARYTAEKWTEAKYRPAPTQAVPAAFQQGTKISGAAVAFAWEDRVSPILEKASEFHARRRTRDKDAWLRLQTLFYALIETARNDAAIRAAIQPLWELIQEKDKQYEAARDAFIPQSASAEAVSTFSDLNLSPRVLTALDTARELAAATWRDRDPDFRVSAMHLGGALIASQVDGDAELSKIGLNPRELRLKLIEYAEGKGESADAWGEALGEEEGLRAGRPVELNSDEPEAVVRLDEDWKSDPLLIRPDVEAFAALLASKSLEPPLSIGLFGPWGSGKTTFLRRLQRAVRRRAAEAKAAEAKAAEAKTKAPSEKTQPTPYVSNIVHVDFNAWHFAEDALTSSFVDTIFRELSSYITEQETSFGKAWTKLKEEKLETTKRTLEAAQAVENAARAAVTDAETALTSARNQAAQLTTNLQSFVQAVWDATKDSLQSSKVVSESGVLEAVGDTVKSGAELRAKLDSIRTRPARLLSDLGWRSSLLFAAMVLVVPPLVAWAVSQIPSQVGQEFISAGTTVLVIVGGWLRTATQAVSKVDQAIAQVSERYESQIAADPNVQRAQTELSEAQTSAVTAELRVQAAREALMKAQTEVASATLPAQMLRLVSDRIEEKTYNKELTTLSLARADLSALSKILRDQKELAALVADVSSPPVDAGDTPVRRPVDRVILYIDDLDRCKPADVVRVLQMVHMLLAFELFVVVVAVDARWIEESLIDSYKWLGGKNGTASVDSSTNGHSEPQRATGHVTPQDYLEKIFQISFWLEPMTSARTARYLGSLVRTQAREQGLVTGLPKDGLTGDRMVEIAGIELDYMRYLAAYAGPSPRRVKRLVNAYRLIKARLSDEQLKEFLARTPEGKEPEAGPYQLVIGLLVIATGAISASTQILKEISDCDPRERPQDLVERFRSRNDPDWTMAAKVIETITRTQKTTNGELRGWARHVGRFLLNSPTALPVTHSTAPAIMAEVQQGQAVAKS